MFGMMRAFQEPTVFVVCLFGKDGLRGTHLGSGGWIILRSNIKLYRPRRIYVNISVLACRCRLSILEDSIANAGRGTGILDYATT